MLRVQPRPGLVWGGQAGNACGVKDANGLKMKLIKSSWPGPFLCGPPLCHSQRRWNLMAEGHHAVNTRAFGSE